MRSIRHKRGDTFELLLLFPEADYPNGYFLLWDVDAQIRYRDDLVDTLVTALAYLAPGGYGCAGWVFAGTQPGPHPEP